MSHHAEYWILVLYSYRTVQYEAFLPRKTVVHYREVLVKEKIKAFRINESVLEAFRIILVLLTVLRTVEEIKDYL